MVYKTILFAFLLVNFSGYSQNVSIPDAAFKSHLISITPNTYEAKDLAGNYTSVDSNGDGEIQVTEAENISELSCDAVLSVKDMAGIESFKNLIKLEARWMKNLEKLALSANPKLKSLTTNYSNKLTTVDLKSCQALENLELFEAQLFEISLNQNPNLKNILISGKFTSLDLSHNVLLSSLDFRAPNLISLDLANCINLKTINFSNEALVNYSFSQAVNLEQITGSDIKLETIDLSGNNKLKSISINRAQNLQKLLLPTGTDLKWLSIYSSSMSNFDLAHQYLENITISDCNFENIDVSRLPNLKRLGISNCNNIGTIDISKNPNLTLLNAFNLANLKNLYVKNGTTQDFGEEFMNCPKLNYVCCDETEKAFFVAKNVPTVVSDCALSNSETTQKKTISFYPNPAEDQIKFTQKVDHVKIYEAAGNLIFSKKINDSVLSIDQLRTGIYFIEFTMGNETYSQKLLKK